MSGSVPAVMSERQQLRLLALEQKAAEEASGQAAQSQSQASGLGERRSSGSSKASTGRGKQGDAYTDQGANGVDHAQLEAEALAFERSLDSLIGGEFGLDYDMMGDFDDLEGKSSSNAEPFQHNGHTESSSGPLTISAAKPAKSAPKKGTKGGTPKTKAAGSTPKSAGTAKKAAAG